MSEMKTEQKQFRERIFWLLLFMAVFTATFSVASEIELAEEEAQIIENQVQEKFEQATNNTIFLNNIALSLVMFIPAFGVVFGMFSAFATGISISAFELPYPAFAILWLSPFGLIELVAYSIAMSRSLLIIKRRKFLRQDKKIIGIEVGIVVALVFTGGIVESIMLGIPINFGL